MILTNPVVISVIVLVVLSLLRIHVIFSLLIATIVGGLVAGLSIVETLEILVGGLGGQGETALSYILLGVLAVMIAQTGVLTFLIRRILPLIRGRRGIVLFSIAALASLSQNLVPIHIAFIPILIPPLLSVFDRMKIDRRAIATALTFGLKAPYMLIPFGFGFIFHEIIWTGMNDHGMAIEMSSIPLAMAFPVGGMVLGLIVAVLFTYRKDRIYEDVETQFTAETEAMLEGDVPEWEWKHFATLFALLIVLVLQIVFGSLVFASLGGIFTMFILGSIKWGRGDEMIESGVKMMGAIAFVMLIASGYATVLTETDSVTELVEAATAVLGDSKFLATLMMMGVGLLVTMGIGTSFGTIPILAAIFVPLCLAMGFSPLATAALIGSAGAIGDAGSPASDSTLGPTAGLNADGQHHHIWDTCVPTFIHYNIPIFIFGIVAALVL